MRQVRASTLPTPTQHPIVSSFGGAQGAAGGGGLGSGISGRVLQRLAAGLTDPSAVFLNNVHTMGVGAPRRGTRATAIAVGPRDLGLSLSRDRPGRVSLAVHVRAKPLKGHMQWAARRSELATLSSTFAIGQTCRHWGGREGEERGGAACPGRAAE